MSGIEVRVRELPQLFDSMDPSPFREQDVARDAEEYIVDSAKELARGKPLALQILVDTVPSEADVATAADAIRAHFGRRALHLRRAVRELLRDGAVSLAIGLTFLVLFFLLGQGVARLLGVSPWSTLARESLLIGGWVAMWRPLEVFLYDWWPIRAEARLFDRLSAMTVLVVASR